MDIGEIIFDDEKNWDFTDEFFIIGEPNIWKVSQIMDGTTWDEKK